jgi:tRNA(Ile)-lysidine synthase
MSASRSLPDLQSTRFTRAFEKRCARAIADGSLLTKGDRVMVGFSGGPDSTALLVALAHLKIALGVQVRAAHFDHRLRSREEAEGDAAFVRALCRKLRVPVEFGSGDVRARARRKKESIEEAARAMRYRFLKRAAKELGCTVVAVAHNRGDQAETVLMRMIRGAGVDGIAGMRPRARWPFGGGPDVVRPLLDVPRGEIERYCAELGLEPRRDPTNDLPVGTRNRIRSELMPMLRTFNPRIEEALARLAASTAMDVDEITATVDGFWRHPRVTLVRKESVRFAREIVATAPPSWTVRLVRRAYEHLSASAKELEEIHTQALLRTMTTRRGKTSLPGGLTARTTSDWITISTVEPPLPPELPAKRLRVRGETRVSRWKFESTVESKSKRIGTLGGLEARIDADAVKRPLSVRSRQPGDRLRPLGLSGSKKVQDILVDAKVPVEERDGVPIVCDERGIVWVVGHCIDERVKVTNKTKRVIRIVATRA